MDNVKILNDISSKLNADPSYIKSVPDQFITASLLLKLIIKDPSIIKYIPSKFRTSDLIALSFMCGGSVTNMDSSDLNLNTSFLACVLNYNNFFELPSEFRYPLNFAGACYNNPELLDSNLINDQVFLKKTLEYLSLFEDAVRNVTASKFVEIS